MMNFLKRLKPFFILGTVLVILFSTMFLLVHVLFFGFLVGMLLLAFNVIRDKWFGKKINPKSYFTSSKRIIDVKPNHVDSRDP